MARIKNNNQVLALCEMGDCSSCALEKSGTCLEALGLNDATVCSEIEAVKMDGTLQKCFVQNNCCGTWDEFVSTWKAETGSDFGLTARSFPLRVTDSDLTHVAFRAPRLQLRLMCYSSRSCQRGFVR